MDSEYFFKKLNEKMKYLLDEEDVFCDIDIDDEEELGDASWTSLFNTAVYLTVHDYNELKDKKDKVKINPEPGGRGGFSDFLIVSNDEKDKLIEIEHENKPLNKPKTKKRKFKNNIEKSIFNLSSKSNAEKVLITYTFENTRKDVSLNELLNMIKKYKTNYKLADDIVLIYGENGNDKKELYKKKII